MGDAKIKRLQQRVDDLEALAGEARALKMELSERANETRVRGCYNIACRDSTVRVGALRVASLVRLRHWSMGNQLSHQLSVTVEWARSR
jgi:hypothetical protein